MWFGGGFWRRIIVQTFVRVLQNHVPLSLVFLSAKTLHLFPQVFPVCPGSNQERGQHCRNVEQGDGVVEFLHCVMRNQEKEWREWSRLRWYATDALWLLLSVAIETG